MPAPPYAALTIVPPAARAAVPDDLVEALAGLRPFARRDRPRARAARRAAPPRGGGVRAPPRGARPRLARRRRCASPLCEKNGERARGRRPRRGLARSARGARPRGAPPLAGERR